MRQATVRLIVNVFVLALTALLVLGQVSHVLRAPLPALELAQGRLLSNEGGIPAAEAFLFSAPQNTPFDSEGWIAGLAAYQWQAVFGMQSLRVIPLLALFFAFLLVLARSFRRGSSPFISAVFSLAAFAALSQMDLSFRECLSLFFFALALYLMEGAFWASLLDRWIYLPLLATLWVNVSSAAWILAPVAALWSLDASSGEQRPQRHGFALASVLALLGLSLCLRPEPLSTLRALMHQLSFDPAISPQELGASQAGLGVVAVCAALILASSWTRAGRARLRSDGALVIGLGLLALGWRSLLPLVCLWAAPVAAARWDSISALFPGAAIFGWVARLAFLVAGVALAPRALTLAKDAPTNVGGPLPKQTLEFYERQLLSAALLTEPEWGDPLAWRLGPPTRLAWTSRAGSITSAKTRVELYKAWRGEADTVEALDALGADAVLARRGAPMAKALATATRWQPLSFDNVSVLYLRATPPNADLIKIYAPRGLRPGDPERFFDPSRVAQAEADIETRLRERPDLGVLWLAQAELFLAKGKDARARLALEQGLRADPEFAEGYLRLGTLQLQRGDKVRALALWRRGVRLDAPDWVHARLEKVLSQAERGDPHE